MIKLIGICLIATIACGLMGLICAIMARFLGEAFDYLAFLFGIVAIVYAMVSFGSLLIYGLGR
jgi:hypothetical protein